MIDPDWGVCWQCQRELEDVLDESGKVEEDECQ